MSADRENLVQLVYLVREAIHTARLRETTTVHDIYTRRVPLFIADLEGALSNLPIEVLEEAHLKGKAA